MALNTFLDRPRQWHARRWFFQVHLWAGVLTALYVIVSSLTGSALIFHKELSELAAPSPRIDPSRGDKPISPETALEVLRNSMPGYRLGAFVLPEQSGGAYGAYLLSRGRFVFTQVHPATGEVVKIVTRDNSIWRWIEDLHNNLLSGRTGRIVNGIGGLSLLLLCATGLIIWWPGRSRWARGLRIDPTAKWPRLIWELHGVLGTWSLALTFLIALTGVYHTWPQLFRSAVASILPIAEQKKPITFPEAKGSPTASVLRLIASAKAACPGQRVYSVQFPPDQTQVIRAVMARTHDAVLSQADTVLLHPVSAEVVRIERYASQPVGERLLRWLPPLHTGHFAGTPGKLIWAATGLVMAVLAATGLILWWNRVVRRQLTLFRAAPSNRPAESRSERLGSIGAPY